MADERALIFQIKLDLDKLQRSLKQAQSRALGLDTFQCQRDNYFVSAITDARMAATSLQQQLRTLAEQRNDNAIRAAFVHAEGLQTDIARFFKDPSILKLSTALSHLDAILDFAQKKLDPEYQRLGAAQTPQVQGISVQERKDRFLRLWQAERGALRLKNIFEDLTILKYLLTKNILLVKSKTLNTSTQKRTQYAETQTDIEQRVLSQLSELYSLIFKPCLTEGELSVFHTPTPFKTNLTRKCDIRRVFFNKNPLEDSVAIAASDILCAQTEDIVDLYVGWLKEYIGAKFTLISIVMTILHLKDAVLELTAIIPTQDSMSLKGLFWTWYQTERDEFGKLSLELKTEYPGFVTKITP